MKIIMGRRGKRSTKTPAGIANGGMIPNSTACSAPAWIGVAPSGTTAETDSAIVVS
jgi:hypothetical protein